MPAYTLTDEMVRRVRMLVRNEVKERFAPPSGQRSFPGGQREIARRMHISHATLNLCLLQDKKDFGIDVLIGLRAYFAETGRPMTLDEMLGLDALPNRPPREQDVESRLSLLEAQIDELRGRKRRSHVRQRTG